jgi:hypothetical protein
MMNITIFSYRSDFRDVIFARKANITTTFRLLRRFKVLKTCINALFCPFLGVLKRRSNIQHVVVI